MDIIHGENSPMVRVTQEECERNMDNLKNNMTKAFDYALGKAETFYNVCIITSVNLFLFPLKNICYGYSLRSF